MTWLSSSSRDIGDVVLIPGRSGRKIRGQVVDVTDAATVVAGEDGRIYRIPARGAAKPEPRSSERRPQRCPAAPAPRPERRAPSPPAPPPPPQSRRAHRPEAPQRPRPGASRIPRPSEPLPPLPAVPRSFRPERAERERRPSRSRASAAPASRAVVVRPADVPALRAAVAAFDRGLDGKDRATFRAAFTTALPGLGPAMAFDLARLAVVEGSSSGSGPALPSSRATKRLPPGPRAPLALPPAPAPAKRPCIPPSLEAERAAAIRELGASPHRAELDALMRALSPEDRQRFLLRFIGARRRGDPFTSAVLEARGAVQPSTPPREPPRLPPESQRRTGVAITAAPGTTAPSAAEARAIEAFAASLSGAEKRAFETTYRSRVRVEPPATAFLHARNSTLTAQLEAWARTLPVDARNAVAATYTRALEGGGDVLAAIAKARAVGERAQRATTTTRKAASTVPAPRRPRSSAAGGAADDMPLAKRPRLGLSPALFAEAQDLIRIYVADVEAHLKRGTPMQTAEYEARAMLVATMKLLMVHGIGQLDAAEIVERLTHDARSKGAGLRSSHCVRCNRKIVMSETSVTQGRLGPYHQACAPYSPLMCAGCHEPIPEPRRPNAFVFEVGHFHPFCVPPVLAAQASWSPRKHSTPEASRAQALAEDRQRRGGGAS